MSAYDPEYTRGLDDYTSKADGPGASGSLQKLVDWANAGYFGDNWLGVINSDDMILGFTTGNAAMMVGGTWNISTIDQNNPDLNYGAFAIPAEDGTAGLVGTAANGFSINANTQNKEAAEAFVPPAWFDKDVTYCKEYHNSYLALELHHAPENS